MRCHAVRARRHGLAAALAAGALVSTAGLCRADLTVVSRITVTHGDGPANTRSVTTSFHGNLVRTETDRLISLYDARAQTLSTIDKQKQTYRTKTLRGTEPAASGLLSHVTFQTQARVVPKDESRIIAGKQARRYVGHATIALAMNGLSGAANQTTLEIEEWASEALTPPVSLERADPTLRLLGSLETIRGMEPLVRELARVKGMPLMSRISITTSAPGGAKRPSVVTESQVVSLSEAPLSADLFRVPSGYRKVDPAPIPSTANLRALHADRSQ